MNIDNAFPSKYLKAADFATPTTYEIKVVYNELVGQTKDQKPVIYFAESDKGMVLNKTNANTLKGIYGPDTGNWKGEPIELYATEVQFQDKMVNSIRLRKPAEAFIDDDVPDFTAA